MIYELREYIAEPGRVDALHRRFADHTLSLFARHGMEVAGFWTDQKDDHRVVYLLRFASAEARRDAWNGFIGDPEWNQVKSDSEADGPIVAEIHSRLLSPTTYWE
jgi:hypothetical protein